MKSIQTQDIRNVALVGHGHSGKTSLVEAMLYTGGAIDRLGKTENGTATTDYSDDEHSHAISIRLGLAHVMHDGKKLNLLDTPGYGNFLFDAKVGLSVADTAVFVLDATSGIEVQTNRVWKFATELGVPARLIALNKMDRENADFAKVVADVQERWGREAVPVQLPIGKGADFKGVVDLVSGKAWTWKADGSVKAEKADVPADMADDVSARREALTEMVAESDEDLMEKFLEAGELSAEDLSVGLAKAVRVGGLIPIACTNAVDVVGVSTLMDLLANLGAPADIRGEREGKDGKSRPISDDAPVSLQIFKTLVMPTGRLSLFRLASGQITADMVLHDGTSEAEERCSMPLLMQGKDHFKSPAMHAGDIGCFMKLKEAKTGHTLSDKSDPIDFEPLAVPPAPMSYAIEAKNQGDEEKIGNALAKIADEDAMLRYHFDPETKELVVEGAGDRHMNVVIEGLEHRYKVQAFVHPPRVPYRESITTSASGSYRHKKQSGGSGQFGEVHMEIKPLPTDTGFEYDTSRIFGGSISQNFFPSIEKGILEVMKKGPVSGCPVVDIRVEVFDGKMHPVDSKDVAFQIAGRMLMRDLVLKAKPALLEPIMMVSVTCPEESMGDVMGDLSGRRGKVQGMGAESGSQVINALVPLREMLTYQAQLKSVTGGQGDYTMEFDHYDRVPAQIQKEIIAEAKIDHADEEHS